MRVAFGYFSKNVFLDKFADLLTGFAERKIFFFVFREILAPIVETVAGGTYYTLFPVFVKRFAFFCIHRFITQKRITSILFVPYPAPRHSVMRPESAGVDAVGKCRCPAEFPAVGNCNGRTFRNIQNVHVKVTAVAEKFQKGVPGELFRRS